MCFYKDSERRGQSQIYLNYAEPHPIFYKDKANREQRHQTCLKGYAEMPLIFYKDKANREQRHQTCLKGYAEMPLIFYKDNSFLCISDISGEDFKNK